MTNKHCVCVCKRKIGQKIVIINVLKLKIYIYIFIYSLSKMIRLNVQKESNKKIQNFNIFFFPKVRPHVFVTSKT